MTQRANLQSPQSFSQVPYGRPSPIPLAGPEQRQERVRTPALPPLPWHCHRACPAHCQLPTLGQRTQTAAPAYLTLTAAYCSQALRTGVEGNVSNIYLRPKAQKEVMCCFFFAEPQHSTITTAPRLALTCKLPTKWNPPILRSMSDLAELSPLLLLICAKQCMQPRIKNKLRDHNQSKSLMLVFLLVSKFCS